MNPSISEQFVQSEIEKDPDAARSEWLALFRQDIEAAFSLESIELLRCSWTARIVTGL